MGLDESYQSRRLRWDVCFDQNAARNIQNTNSGLLERDVQCNVLIHDRSPGNKPQRQTWWHASRRKAAAPITPCEDEAQQLVAKIVVHGHFDHLGCAVERAVQPPRDLLML